MTKHILFGMYQGKKTNINHISMYIWCNYRTIHHPKCNKTTNSKYWRLCSYKSNTHLFMIGGFYNGGTLSVIQIYDINKTHWIYLWIYPLDISMNISQDASSNQYCQIINNVIYMFLVDWASKDDFIPSYHSLKIVKMIVI